MRALIEILTREENVRMQYEILIMLCAFSIPALKLESKKKLAAVWTAVALVFIYLHRALLPLIVSGVYVYLIAGILSVILKGKLRAFALPVRVLKIKAGIYLDRSRVLYTLVPLLIVMIQACRINIAIDYDSLRYGLRSDVLLTGGNGLKGFFENTGLVNLVYTYPKGFELLTRPLYFGHTYAYVLCVNLWMLVLVLILAGSVTGLLTGSRNAEVFTALLMSLVPGITNMSVTAKSDLITLLMQLIFLYCAVRFLKTGGHGDSKAAAGELTGAGLAALFASYAFKPTALVFSSLTGLTVLTVLLYYRKEAGYRIGLDKNGIRILIPSLLFLTGITLRTYLITGMPFTSVFTGVFEKLGMKLKYPFRIQPVSSKAPADLVSILRFYLGRIGRFLFCPAGEDMLHVQMAWGGLAFTLMALLIPFAAGKAAECMEDLNRLQRIGTSDGETGAVPEDGAFSPEGYRLVGAVTSVMAILSLITLYLLYQIDGNYYMLLYTLVIIIGCASLYARAAMEVSPLGKNLPVRFSGRNTRAVILLSGVMIYFTAFTGWAGPVGLTPVDPVNRGYYNHEVEFGIFDPLHWDRHTRVVAFAAEPDCYLLKGRVESWVDIDGSGGNVYLTDTKLNIFKEYLSFADIDYIYADLAFLKDREDERHQRADTLFQYMLEDGDFEEVVLAENSSGRIFAKIDKERMAEEWEIPLPQEKIERTAAQCAWFESIGGYR